MRADRFMRLAELHATRSTHPKFKMGAIVSLGSKIIGYGRNDKKTHPKWGINGWGYLHAETAAIACAKKRHQDISGASVYVYRTGGKLARPCRRCYKAMIAEGIKSIHFSGE